MTKHGGKRKGSGRKAIDDPKVTLSIYPRKSEVEKCGGMEQAKAVALSAVMAVRQKRKK